MAERDGSTPIDDDSDDDDNNITNLTVLLLLSAQWHNTTAMKPITHSAET